MYEIKYILQIMAFLNIFSKITQLCQISKQPIILYAPDLIIFLAS